MHYGMSGHPNRWGNKIGLLLFLLTATGIYVLLTGASRYQQLINLPMKIDRNAPQAQSLLLKMSILLKAILLSIFVYILWVSMNTALGRSEGLGKQFLPVSLAAVFFTLGFYLFKLRRYRE